MSEAAQMPHLTGSRPDVTSSGEGPDGLIEATQTQVAAAQFEQTRTVLGRALDSFGKALSRGRFIALVAGQAGAAIPDRRRCRAGRIESERSFAVVSNTRHGAGYLVVTRAVRLRRAGFLALELADMKIGLTGQLSSYSGAQQVIARRRVRPFLEQLEASG